MKIVCVLFATLLALLLSGNATGAALSRVVVVETDDVSGYLKGIEEIRAINKRLGIADGLRVWRARFAGPEAGSIVVVIEAADLAAYAANDAKQRGDAEFMAVLKRLDGLRKIASDSLYEELK